MEMVTTTMATLVQKTASNGFGTSKYPSNTFRNSDVSDDYDISPTAGDEDDVTVIGADIAGKIRNSYQKEHICMHATQSDRITFNAIFSF